jgi:hypothetical protein
MMFVIFRNNKKIKVMKNLYELNRNIYITSDEEIKEGDYGYDIVHNFVVKIIKELIGNYLYKKIILTTDQDLIKDGVQAIDDEFLEFIVKNPSCESIEVESGLFFYAEGEDRRYKITIPKEEPKQEILEEVECNNCGYLMSLTEDESVYACYNSECTSCYEEYEEEPKQETLEKAAHRILTQYGIKSIGQSIGVIKVQELMVEMAKWQQERMYSEEEVLEILEHHTKYLETFIYQYIDKNDMEENKIWFEQFKNK